jgi:plastocyanin
MNKNYFTLLMLSVFFCYAQAQTTHFIDWEISVGANATITIDVGDTIEWTNIDIGMPHDVSSTDPNAPAGFGSGLLGDNDTYSFTFNAAVVFDYGCSFHPGSMDGTITVLAAGSCDPPTNLMLNNVTDTTADFSWSASPDETGGYEWVVMLMGDDPNTDPPVAQGSVTTGVTTAAATGLTPETMYMAYVKTICAMGLESNFSSPLHFMTDEEECEALTNLTVDSFTDTTVSFSWIEPIITSNILGYGAVVVLTGDVPFVDNHVAEDIYNVGITSAVIDQLQPDTTYDLYMASVCSMTPFVISDFEMVTFTTDEGMNVSDNEWIRLNYYPNPISETLTLDARIVIKTVEVFTLKGQKVIESQVNQQSVQLDLSDLATGVYMLKASFEGGSTKVLRIIKE